jgi:hypothetical protein
VAFYLNPGDRRNRFAGPVVKVRRLPDGELGQDTFSVDDGQSTNLGLLNQVIFKAMALFGRVLEVAARLPGNANLVDAENIRLQLPQLPDNQLPPIVPTLMILF